MFADLGNNYTLKPARSRWQSSDKSNDKRGLIPLRRMARKLPLHRKRKKIQNGIQGGSILCMVAGNWSMSQLKRQPQRWIKMPLRAVPAKARRRSKGAGAEPAIRPFHRGGKAQPHQATDSKAAMGRQVSARAIAAEDLTISRSRFFQADHRFLCA
jgi:hypothetical protein